MITEETALTLGRELLANHFPEIKVGRVKFEFVKKQDYYMAVAILHHYYIKIDKSALKFSEKAFIGCLAHELAHIVIASKRNFLRKLIGLFIQSFGETKEERSADLIVVNKGLGEELLQFHAEHNKKYKAYKPNEGLTKKEIKNLLQNP